MFFTNSSIWCINCLEVEMLLSLRLHLHFRKNKIKLQLFNQVMEWKINAIGALHNEVERVSIKTRRNYWEIVIPRVLVTNYIHWMQEKKKTECFLGCYYVCWDRIWRVQSICYIVYPCVFIATNIGHDPTILKCTPFVPLCLSLYPFWDVLKLLFTFLN